MAQDIVPIELGLTEGNLVTLWAPRWREEGEEWEAFLGDDEDLFAFSDVAHLVAFVRTVAEHDLADHPAWQLVPQLPAADLVPDEDQRYDVVGVPELIAADPDTWTVSTLADVVGMLRSIADVCDLQVVHEVLDAAEGFQMLDDGMLAFGGREGSRRWDEIIEVVANRWDEIIDTLDELVSTPEVDADAAAVAEQELAEAGETEPTAAGDEADEAAGSDESDKADETEESDEDTEDDENAEDTEEEDLGFWSSVGIDPIRITTSDGEYYTLRCYIDDEPVFLGSHGRIDVFRSERALARYLADKPTDHDLADVATWPEVAHRAEMGELEVEVADDNAYTLIGLADDLAEGPSAVDPVHLELATELIVDAEQWAGSDTADRALAGSEPLGWLVSFVLRPDPNRLAPSAPFDAEVAAWRRLTQALEDRLNVH